MTDSHADEEVVPFGALHAARFANTTYFFAACVLVLFPTVVGAGTASDTERYVVGGFAFLCALLASVLKRRGRLAFVGPALLMVGGWPLGAPWLTIVGALGGAYVAWGLAKDDAAGEDDAADGDFPEHALRDNVEAIAMALVLALLFKTLIAEAFVIPTGSMEPTIFGAQRGARKGDRILAIKPTLLLGDPPRWSIVVFKFPLFRATNYIKRVVGLPGETMEIHEGDIWIDGELMAKPDAIQETLWRPRFPREGKEPAAGDLAREWRVEGDAEFVGDGVRFTGASTLALADERPRGSDFKLEADIEFGAAPTGDVVVRLRIDGRESGKTVGRPELVVGTDAATIGEGDLSAPVDATLSSSMRIGYSVADRVGRAYIDGRQVAFLDFRKAELEGSNAGRRISIEVSGGSGTISNVTLHEDIEYLGRHTFEIPDDGFVMLGDNTSNSSDSRKWRANVLRMNDGTEFVAADQIHTESDGQIRNFHLDDQAGVYRFLDSYAVPREIPADQVESVSAEQLPYARRADLVGRAFFIFFPFPPFEDEFRPRFLP